MMRRLSTIVLLLIAPSLIRCKPNIVILFADNLGYADVGLFGNEGTTDSTSTRSTSRTPNIDSLGDQGMMFHNWNSVAHLCSASRATLLTGKYPVRTGIYPGVFKPDAANGLKDKTLASYLKDEGYQTSIVGKWHLGHRPEYLPTSNGFDEWLGVPYHMSGGSVDQHTCVWDEHETMWLPLYRGLDIVQQPVRVQDLTEQYAVQSEQFIRQHADTPFFLYMAFSHVHQLCAPRDLPEQPTCQWASGQVNATFGDAVEEMDQLAGRILTALDEAGVTNNTLVLFTSDNGPWVAEQSCSGLKGPFKGQWYVR
jgi:arylsulfatase A